jgi:archaellum component FlaC
MKSEVLDKLHAVQTLVQKAIDTTEKKLQNLSSQVSCIASAIEAHQSALSGLVNVVEEHESQIRDLKDTMSCVIHDIQLLRGDYDDDNDSETSPSMESCSPITLGSPLSSEFTIRKQIVINLMGKE